MEKPSEIFEGPKKGSEIEEERRGRQRTKAGDEERGMKNGPGLDRFGFGFEAWSCQGCFLLVWTALALALKHGPTRGERGSIIGLNLGHEDRQERVFVQNGVVDRRHDSTRSPFPRRKRNGNSRRNLSRIDEEGTRSWLQVGARIIGRGIGGIQR